jgi:hypothetical protein
VEPRVRRREDQPRRTLKEVSEGNEVVYVPCHRSHMDYLLMSYIIYHQGYALPHIAAGINLNIPVVGRYLRKGGAFFIRRSFAGNALYTVVFMKYLAAIMARGHSIEYFIEGGRSRTGRLLQPKTGMLSMTVRSFLRDPVRPVVFVPVYFGYERIVEANTTSRSCRARPRRRRAGSTCSCRCASSASASAPCTSTWASPSGSTTCWMRSCRAWRDQTLRRRHALAGVNALVGDLASSIMRGHQLRGGRHAHQPAGHRAARVAARRLARERLARPARAIPEAAAACRRTARGHGHRRQPAKSCRTASRSRSSRACLTSSATS